VELLRDSSRAGNLLGSFLAGDRSQIPFSILSDGTADYLQPTNLEKLGAEALQAVQTNGTLLGWSAIYCVFGDLPLNDCDRKLMESAILNVDLIPFERDLAACETLLHAASLQAAVLQNITLTEHLSEQTAKMAAVVREQSRDGQNVTDGERQFLSSLFQIAINLSRSTQGSLDRTSEYARLFARIADAFPRSAAICRHFLNRIWPCEASQAKMLWPSLIRSRAMNL
jgi:hypothetical protein